MAAPWSNVVSTCSTSDWVVPALKIL